MPEPGDLRGLASALHAVTGDEGLRARLAAGARRRAATLPTWRRSGELFFEAVRELLVTRADAKGEAERMRRSNSLIVSHLIRLTGFARQLNKHARKDQTFLQCHQCRFVPQREMIKKLWVTLIRLVAQTKSVVAGGEPHFQVRGALPRRRYELLCRDATFVR